VSELKYLETIQNGNTIWTDRLMFDPKELFCVCGIELSETNTRELVQLVV
jgi:hypothetical protein